MKAKLLLKQILLISVFGLISCTSDKAPDTTPAKENKVKVVPPKKGDNGNSEFRVTQPDGSFKEAKNLTEVNIESNFTLNESWKDKVKSADVKSLCQTSALRESLEFSTTKEKTIHFKVRNILPAEIFSPQTNATPAVFCTFKITFKMIEGSDVILDLNNEIRILRTQDYENFGWDPAEMAEPAYLRFSDLPSDQPVNLPFIDGKIKTLCEQYSMETLVKDGEHTKHQLFPEHIFENKNSKVCRIHLRDAITQETWISKTFTIQYSNPKLKYLGREDYFPSSPSVSLGRQPLISYQFWNRGKTPIYLSLGEMKQHNVFVIPVYLIENAYNFLRAASQTIPAQWMVNTPQPSTKSPRHKKETMVKLNPGETIEIYLAATGKFSCPAAASHNAGCNLNPIFTGNQYIFRPAPAIFMSQNDDPNTKAWVQLRLRNTGFKPVKTGAGVPKLKVWSAYRHTQKTCSWVKPQKDPGFNLDYVSGNRDLCN